MPILIINLNIVKTNNKPVVIRNSLFLILVLKEYFF